MDWLSFTMRLPLVIAEAMRIVEHIKGGATGAEKKAAVIASIPASVELVDFAAGRDVLNDPAIMALRDAFIDAEKVAMKAKEALQQGILTRAGVPAVPASPSVS